MELFSYKRIVVIGTTSFGKSTLAKTLADKFACAFIELDALHWEPNWQEAEPHVFRVRAEKATLPKAWVAAGNYSVVRDILWNKAEVIIWLDYPLPIVFWRLLIRTLRRTITQEELWNGNRESFWTHFKFWSEDSLFHWLLKTYWRRKREFPILFSLPEYQHLKIYRFNHPRELEAWLDDLGQLFSS